MPLRQSKRQEMLPFGALSCALSWSEQHHDQINESKAWILDLVSRMVARQQAYQSLYGLISLHFLYPERATGVPVAGILPTNEVVESFHPLKAGKWEDHKTSKIINILIIKIKNQLKAPKT